MKQRWKDLNLCTGTSCDGMVRGRAADIDGGRKSGDAGHPGRGAPRDRRSGVRPWAEIADPVLGGLHRRSRERPSPGDRGVPGVPHCRLLRRRAGPHRPARRWLRGRPGVADQRTRPDHHRVPGGGARVRGGGRPGRGYRRLLRAQHQRPRGRGRADRRRVPGLLPARVPPQARQVGARLAEAEGRSEEARPEGPGEARVHARGGLYDGSSPSQEGEGRQRGQEGRARSGGLPRPRLRPRRDRHPATRHRLRLRAAAEGPHEGGRGGRVRRGTHPAARARQLRRAGRKARPGHRGHPSGHRHRVPVRRGGGIPRCAGGSPHLARGRARARLAARGGPGSRGGARSGQRGDRVGVAAIRGAAGRRSPALYPDPHRPRRAGGGARGRGPSPP